MDTKALYQLSYGVYLCTTWDEGRPVGCVANSAMQITSDPATVAVSLNRVNHTHACVEDTGRFALCVMGEKCDPRIIGTFGFRSSRDFDKFAGTPYAVRGKMPVPDDCVSWFSCKVVGKLETSTHTVFLGEIQSCEMLRGGTPMTYAYYHKVLKGKTSVNAPTYVAEEPKSSAKWRCKVCGYLYDGETPFEELPDDWVCPICGVGKSEFEQTE